MAVEEWTPFGQRMLFDARLLTSTRLRTPRFKADSCLNEYSFRAITSFLATQSSAYTFDFSLRNVVVCGEDTLTLVSMANISLLLWTCMRTSSRKPMRRALAWRRGSLRVQILPTRPPLLMKHTMESTSTGRPCQTVLQFLVNHTLGTFPSARASPYTTSFASQSPTRNPATGRSALPHLLRQKKSWCLLVSESKTVG
jgi:hypothetical protein